MQSWASTNSRSYGLAKPQADHHSEQPIVVWSDLLNTPHTLCPENGSSERKKETNKRKKERKIEKTSRRN
jgi:hypothetical protein